MAANLVFKNGFFKTNSRSFNDQNLKDALLRFIQQKESYKLRYIQHQYEYGFDGYSYLGQTDSTNQYATDLLHSFVISDFIDSSKFPQEFNKFFSMEWAMLQEKIKILELELKIKQEN